MPYGIFRLGLARGNSRSGSIGSGVKAEEPAFWCLSWRMCGGERVFCGAERSIWERRTIRGRGMVEACEGEPGFAVRERGPGVMVLAPAWERAGGQSGEVLCDSKGRASAPLPLAGSAWRRWRWR